MRRDRQRIWGLFAAVTMLCLPAASAWGYFFDDARTMSLSGFAYTRATIQTGKGDEIGTGKGLYKRGNLVQHRNFLTLEWRHNLNRVSRNFPTIGPLFQFLDIDAFDYYLNLREEYDGVWDYGGTSTRRQLDGGGGSEYWDKYYGRRRDAQGNFFNEKFPGELGRYKNFGYVTSVNFLEKKVNSIRLFEWYFNITKGPLFLRIGRQNLSWGETDAFRLLDQINPLDNAFGGFTTSLDERRIPLFMLRAQWNFGTVGPIQDLTLEGFVSPDRRTAQIPVLAQGGMWTLRTATSPVAVNQLPCGGPVFGEKLIKGSNLGFEGQRVPPCSVRAQGPRSVLKDSRGGGRIIGTIRDFTFSIAHYYTWSDTVLSQAGILSPTPEHLAWDLSGDLFTRMTGLPAIPANNPWGPNDPTIGADGIRTGPGNFAVPSKVERNIWVPIDAKRVQITGASLSFPLNALTGMFVGSDNPLFYLYTTFRGEFAYTRNVPRRTEIHSSSAGIAINRFLTPRLEELGLRDESQYEPLFLPGGAFSSEGACFYEDGSGRARGCRRARQHNRDQWAFNIGLDHNQWIRWLNPSNSFVFSAQFFKTHVNNNKRKYKAGVAPSLTNDAFRIGVRPRSAATRGPSPNAPERIGGNGNRSQPCLTEDGTNLPPCDFDGLLKQATDSELLTLAINTRYLAGNLTPRLVFFYDFAGSWLIQPGLDWTFWDPFRLNIRYNFIDGKYTGIGFFKYKDSIWFELQYLLY